MRLSRADIDRIASDVQIRYCLGKEDSFDLALARAVETATAERCAKVCEQEAIPLDRHKWPTPYQLADAIRAAYKEPPHAL